MDPLHNTEQRVLLKSLELVDPWPYDRLGGRASLLVRGKGKDGLWSGRGGDLATSEENTLELEENNPRRFRIQHPFQVFVHIFSTYYPLGMATSITFCVRQLSGWRVQ